MKNIKTKSKHHDKIWSSKEHLGSEKLNEAHNSVLKMLPNCKTIIEIGCGTGILAHELKKQGKDILGTDISDYALKKAQKKGIKTLCCDLDSPLTLKDNTFDCAISCQILQHIFKPSALIKEMTRISKKYVIINIPNIAYWKYRLRLLQGKFPFIGKPEQLPIRFFTLRTFKEYISESGLEIEKIEYTGGLPLRRFIPKTIRKKVNILEYFPEIFETGFTVRCKKRTKNNHHFSKTKTI